MYESFMKLSAGSRKEDVTVSEAVFAFMLVWLVQAFVQAKGGC